MAAGLHCALAGSAIAVALAGCTPQSKSVPPDASGSQDVASLAQDSTVKAVDDERDGGELRVDPVPVPPYAPVPFVEKP